VRSALDGRTPTSAKSDFQQAFSPGLSPRPFAKYMYVLKGGAALFILSSAPARKRIHG
jgi:hypothetical protein